MLIIILWDFIKEWFLLWSPWLDLKKTCCLFCSDTCYCGKWSNWAKHLHPIISRAMGFSEIPDNDDTLSLYSCLLFLLNIDLKPILPPKVQCSEETTVGKEELRNSISKEPIYEWEGSQRESLGPITYATKVKLQHMPCQVRALQDWLFIQPKKDENKTFMNISAWI